MNNDSLKIHKSGFVNIIGNPNVGKSTLMNALVGEKLSIVTAKAQTTKTRHRLPFTHQHAKGTAVPRSASQAMSVAANGLTQAAPTPNQPRNWP